MMTMSMMSGKWQMMTIWKSDLADMEWKMSPDGVKWWDAMVKITGSKEEAVKIREEHGSLVAASTSEMARATEW
jgi:hypothetical protein